MSANLDLPLADWTFETIKHVVTTHDFEPGAFDFKVALVGTGNGRDHLRDSIRKTACSMANSSGGHILFGIADAKKGGTPECRLVGLPVGGDLRKHFGDMLSGIQPEVFFEAVPKPIPHPTDASKGFFVVYIPQSARRPHMLDHVFLRRGLGGTTEKMGLQEVRDQMLFTEGNLSRLKLLRMELLGFKAGALDLQTKALDLHNVMKRFDTVGFRMLSAEVSVLLPRDKWSYSMGLVILANQAGMLNELLIFYAHKVMMTERGGWKDEATKAVRASATTLMNYCDGQLHAFDTLFGEL